MHEINFGNKSTIALYGAEILKWIGEELNNLDKKEKKSANHE